MDLRLSVKSGRRVTPLKEVDLADFALVLSGYLERKNSISTSVDGGLSTVKVESHLGSYTVMAEDWKRVVPVLIHGLPISPYLSVYERTLQALKPLFSGVP